MKDLASETLCSLVVCKTVIVQNKDLLTLINLIVKKCDKIISICVFIGVS